MRIIARSGAEARLLELLAMGVRDGPEIERLGYKIAVACLLRGIYRERNYCRECFFRSHCALWKNLEWFERREKFWNALIEIAGNNPEIRYLRKDRKENRERRMNIAQTMIHRGAGVTTKTS